ncbi:MAG: hypothetical protein L6V82_04680 [Clostridiales bacterium]|nr:MAG: hypothetical protein L6V82_04680 [Clostridiales bacterium]
MTAQAAGTIRASTQRVSTAISRRSKCQKKKRLVLLSEYGGYSYQEKGHVFNNKKFGYRIYNDKESLNAAYKKLHEKLIIPAIKDGLAATVYTQVSDVESEINGFLTYDRRVLKVDPDMVRAVNAQLKL